MFARERGLAINLWVCQWRAPQVERKTVVGRSRTFDRKYLHDESVLGHALRPGCIIDVKFFLELVLVPSRLIPCVFVYFFHLGTQFCHLTCFWLRHRGQPIPLLREHLRRGGICHPNKEKYP